MSAVCRFNVPEMDALRAGAIIQMPRGAHVVCFGYHERHGACVWAMADPLEPMTGRSFILRITGEDLPDPGYDELVYIGSTRPPGSQHLIHCFERVEGPGT